MQPNFLFIILDDLNSWIGALGAHPDVKTPNIDRLANRSALFTRAYCSAPYCNASRMGLFTGLYPSSNGVYHDEPYWEAEQRPPTFIEALKASGYTTVGAGKVFHGVFDYAYAGRAGVNRAKWKDFANRDFLWDSYATSPADVLPDVRPANRLFDFSDFSKVPKWYHHFDWGPIANEFESEMPDSKTAEFIEAFLTGKPSEPFFCAAGIYKPHLPWNVPKKYFDLYDESKISLPLVKDDDLDNVPAIARKWALSPPDHELVTSRGQWPAAVHGYLAAISYADRQVGRILDALSKSDLGQRTIVILCSDNGFHLGEKLHWRKFVLWEEATRVPLIYAPPTGIRQRQLVTAPVSLIDLFPTILDAADIEMPGQRDGESLLPILNGDASVKKNPTLMTWEKGNHSVRSGQWRYTRYNDTTEELYDHRCDSHEWKNLAADINYADVIAQLRTLIPNGHVA